MRFYNSLIILLSFCLSLVGQENDNLNKIIADFEVYQRSNKENWPDLDLSLLKSKSEDYKRLLKRLKLLSASELNEEQKINKEMLELIIVEFITSEEFGIELLPLNAEGGFLAGVVHQIRRQVPESDSSYMKYATMLQELPDYFNRRIKLMRQGIEQRKQSPKLIVKNCLNLLAIWIQRPYARSIYSKGYMTDKQNEQIEVIYNNRVIPAYKKMHAFLKEEYLSKAPTQVGISTVPNGTEYYKSRTAYYSTYQIDPKEVFEIGMTEVNRIIPN